MFGVDERIAAASHGASIWIVLAVAVLLGLRHATDPDHLAAVTTLVAGGRERAARTAGGLGLAWGLGHALTLFAFGLPIILFNSLLPRSVRQAAETAIGFVIVGLALRLLTRWRRGELRFHVHPRAHGARTPRGASRSGSCTAWAEAQASACSSSRRSARRDSPSSRSSSWRCSRRCR
jgi:ABC-type nickel/cobalt efflux system permease component RcnA